MFSPSTQSQLTVQNSVMKSAPECTIPWAKLKKNIPPKPYPRCGFRSLDYFSPPLAGHFEYLLLSTSTVLAKPLHDLHYYDYILRDYDLITVHSPCLSIF